MVEFVNGKHFNFDLMRTYDTMGCNLSSSTWYVFEYKYFICFNSPLLLLVEQVL